MNINALIFDFDGLIIDTELGIYQSWHELYETFNCHLDLEKWLGTIGTQEASFDPAEELERLHGSRVEWQIVEPQRLQRETELINLLPIMPGVLEMLEAARAKGLKIGLASSGYRSWVAGHLERLGLLEYFDSLITYEDVKLTKPDPELYIKALSALGVAPDEAVAFEDSLNGVLAAKRAGIFTIAIPNTLTRHSPIDSADLRLDSLAEIDLASIMEL